MDERVLFDRIHQALDIEPSPDAYDRLRIALAKKPVKPRRWLEFPVRWPKTGLRLAAAMAVVVLAIAATGGFLGARILAERSAQANSDREMAAYKLMLSDDNAKVQTAGQAWTCDSSSHLAACESDASRLIPAQNRWLNDLNRFHTPARFAVADAQLRLHLQVQISREQALIAASRAHDAAAAGRVLTALQGQTGIGWALKIVASILASRQGTVATYLGSLRSEKHGLDVCIECQDLAGQKQYSCAGNELSTCQASVEGAAQQVASFQSAVIRVAAPNSLAAKDNRLQLDLAAAETALKAMADALAAPDPGGFDAGRVSYQQAIAAINRDVADILNS